MAFADFCPITLAGCSARRYERTLLALLSMVRSHPAIASGCAWTWVARWSVPGSFTERISSHVGQISPDKDVNCGYTTAAFTLSPESGASSCCADLPGDWALYAVSVRRLIALPEASSRRSLAVPPLPSASIWANDLNSLTVFTHRGLTPHKFTPVPGVHKRLQRTAIAAAEPRVRFLNCNE
jgi:hypothetical protein